MFTREEFLEKSEIKNPAEAKKYLYLFRLILLFFTISFFTTSYFYKIEYNLFWSEIFSLLSFVFVSWFGYLYVKIQKKLNVALYFNSVGEKVEKKYRGYDLWGNYWIASFLLRVIIGTASFTEKPFDPDKKAEGIFVKIIFNVAGWMLIVLAIVIAIILIQVVIDLVTGSDHLFDLIN